VCQGGRRSGRASTRTSCVAAPARRSALTKGSDKLGRTPSVDCSHGRIAHFNVGGDNRSSERSGRYIFRVLSIDGGGIRGIIPARLLTELEKVAGRSTVEMFDLIVGTSTGGILALALACPGAQGAPQHSAGQLLGLYLEQAEKIFPLGGRPMVRSGGLLGDRAPLDPNAGIVEHFKHFMGYENISRLVAPTGGNDRNYRYPADGLEAVLHEYLGDAQLGASLKPVSITSYDLNSRSPLVFRSWRATDKAVPMRVVARATSAGPTFFPPQALGNLLMVDGGIVANDPGMIAFADGVLLAEAQGRGLRDVFLVSVGTGTPEPTPVEYLPADAVNSKSWISLGIDLFIGAVTDGPAQKDRALLGELLNGDPSSPRYVRLQTTLGGASHAMDDVRLENLQALRAVADHFAQAVSQQLRMIATKLSSV
jgi:predicted acylesterase/phospholipase RssA